MSEQLAPGDHVVVRPGTYTEQVYINQGGSAASDVTLRSEVPGAAQIRAPSGAYSTVIIRDDYVTVEGFDIQGGTGHGVDAESVHHTTVRNNIVHDSGGSGIQYNYSEFITIDGNEVYGNAGTNGYQTSGISVFQSRNITGDTTTEGFRTVVSNNVSYDNIETSAVGGAHTDGNGIIIDDFQNTQTQEFSNYTYPTLVDNNLVYGNGGKGIQVTWSDNVTVRNNTAYHNNVDPQNPGTWRGELSNAQSSNNTWVNNIAVTDPSVNSNNRAIDNTSYDGYSNDDVVWINNLTFNGTPGAASIRNDGGNLIPAASAGNLLGVDPQFVSPPGDFGLATGSPAVNAGSAAYGLGSSDLDGGPRVVDTVDLGAYESDGLSGGPSNTSPRAVDDSGFAATAGSSIVIAASTLLANDVDADGDTLELTSVASPTGGSVRLNAAGNVVFVAADGSADEGGFDYQVMDSGGNTDSGHVSIAIEDGGGDDPAPPVNSDPVAQDDHRPIADPGESVRISAADLLANDTDADGDTLSILGVANAVNGTVTLSKQGNVWFNVDADAVGRASFRYAVSDGNGGISSAKVTMDLDDPQTDPGDPQTDPGDPQETVSFWDGSARPAVITDPDEQPVELGLRFLVEEDGEIAALSFFRGPDNDGPHTGRLWTASGDTLAEVTFDGNGGTGWQTAKFDAPVEVQAGETYVASYHAPEGGYSVSEDYFEGERDAGPIKTTDDAGVYAYGDAGSFPTDSYHASNYWVDPIFQ